MNSKFKWLSLLVILIAIGTSDAAEHPNIVLIFGDDMGIDCVGAFNDKLGLETPHLDKLAGEGMSFMDAHTTSAVCTPSRYGLLTGRYNWRSRLKRGIVGQWERPLIEEGRLTLPEMLRQHGYSTTMIGKWHLGFNWPKKGGGVTARLSEIDFAGPITDGPNGRGFDYWFGDDVPNWPPYAWRENDRLLGEITTTSKELGLTSFTGVGNGPAVADWSLEAVLPEYAERCSRFILEQKGSDKPFFLYFPMPSPHTPIVPDANWKGKSGISDYADFLLETDWAVGEVLRALDDSGQADNTIVLFSTDNGTSPKANFEELAAKGVHLTEHWRGNKADAYEGGHRVPLIVRWPEEVAAGARSDEIVSLVDVMATLAEVVEHELPSDAAEDSLSLLPILKGEKLEAPLHEAIICHSISGHFAVRRGRWKALFCRGSGGWSAPREAEADKQNLAPIQLYDLKADPKEATNLQAQYPEIVADLTKILRRYIEDGRSTPGPPQTNHEGAIHWQNVPWKKETEAESSFRRIVIANTSAEGRLPIATPHSNIVRAWSMNEGGESELLNWMFNKDATKIDLLVPKQAGEFHLLTAEESGRQQDGLIVLSALDAKVVGEKAQLETHPGNHRIGFWVNGDDFVTWTLETGATAAGAYDVELVYSRAGKAGAEAAVTVDETTLPVKLDTTGSWYVYKVQPIGSLTLSDARSHTVEVRNTLQIGAVMNLKAVLLHPKAP